MKYSSSFHLQTYSQTEVVNHILSYLLRYLVGEKPRIEILFYHMLSLRTIIMLTGIQVRVFLRLFMIFFPQPIDHLPLPTDYRMYDYAQVFVEHIHNLHVETR